MVVDKKSREIVCTSACVGRTHDFRLWKESRVRGHPKTLIQGDTGYQGLQKLHTKTELPKKRSKKQPLTIEDKKRNREISSSRVLAENVIRSLKIFKILSERYRNRRTRFGLRLNLIAGIYNYEIRLRENNNLVKN